MRRWVPGDRGWIIRLDDRWAWRSECLALSLDGEKIAKVLRRRVAARAVSVKFDDSLPQLDLSRLDGPPGCRASPGGFALSSRRIDAVACRRIARAAADRIRAERLEGRRRRTRRRAPGGQSGRRDRLRPAFPYLPLAPDIRERLAALSPDGRLRGVSLDWDRGAARSPSWKLAASFEGIGFAAGHGWPGMAGLSGEVSGTDQAGRFTLSPAAGQHRSPGIFAEPRLSFEKLQAGGAGRAATANSR